MQPLVTIVTPSYNQGRFIRTTIESVLSQDYEHIEYIIMDGGSTDETAAVVQEYGDRITWISERDRGQSHAINKGFRMAKGEIVGWLNSDDTIQPGAVSHAVRALERSPGAGAVYGEGYLMDGEGNIKGRFPATEAFNLWKLVYLSDYILQQTVYFRRSVFKDVGPLDETLKWGMDWDILIRIGKRYALEYIPEYMGCLREHGDAKTATGGRERFRELTHILRRHGIRKYPPGYVFYGLDTYGKIWDDWIEQHTPGWLSAPSGWFRKKLFASGRRIIDHILQEAQGWYSDGWVTTRSHFMLPAGNGNLRLRGSLPDLGPTLKGQTIHVRCNGKRQAKRLNFGEFDMVLPFAASSGPANISIRATRSVVPAAEGLGADWRRLAFILQAPEWAR
jgi:glycosyltransferase involved in cell wall biosynthesis